MTPAQEISRVLRRRERSRLLVFIYEQLFAVLRTVCTAAAIYVLLVLALSL